MNKDGIYNMGFEDGYDCCIEFFKKNKGRLSYHDEHYAISVYLMSALKEYENILKSQSTFDIYSEGFEKGWHRCKKDKYRYY